MSKKKITLLGITIIKFRIWLSEAIYPKGELAFFCRHPRPVTLEDIRNILPVTVELRVGHGVVELLAKDQQ